MTENLKTEVINKCPACDWKLDAAICPKEIHARPSAGDLAVCFNCHTILQFTKKLKLKRMDINKISFEDRKFLKRMQDENIKAKEYYSKMH